MLRRLVRAIDRRIGAAGFARSALDKVFPDHFSFMFGEIALYCFAILVLTGTYLTFFFVPSSAPITYQGSYAPLHGVQMSRAYDSVIHLSFDVRAGLVMRQIHHWAALVFLAAIVAHLCRVYFTGAFRRPREINWLVGVTLLLLALANGFLGYSLLDDLLSGTGLRIAYSIAESIPFVGEWVASLVFGGEFPGESTLTRFFVLHVLVVPALIVGLLTAHLAILWRQKHTQFSGPGRTERNVVGSRLFPTYATKSVALFFAVFAVLALLGGLAQINPVWLYGPYRPASVTTAAQPDWYVGWLEGALRLMPAWEVRGFGHTIANVFFPGVLLPGATFAALYAWPFLEAGWLRRRTGVVDEAEHHLLDRPRFHPWRTAIGVGVLTFYAVLFVAGSQDVIASWLDLSVNAVTWVLRTLLVVLPLLTAAVTFSWCRGLAAGSAAEADGDGDDDDDGALFDAPPTASVAPASQSRRRAHSEP